MCTVFYGGEFNVYYILWGRLCVNVFYEIDYNVYYVLWGQISMCTVF